MLNTQSIRISGITPESIVDGEGIRYEILAFIRAIENGQHAFVSSNISIGIVNIMECFVNYHDIIKI